MKQITYNALTKETTIVEVPDMEMLPMPPQEPTTDEKITLMAEQLLLTQEQLNSAQDALDFILMGGM